MCDIEMSLVCVIGDSVMSGNGLEYVCLCWGELVCWVFLVWYPIMRWCDGMCSGVCWRLRESMQDGSYGAAAAHGVGESGVGWCVGVWWGVCRRLCESMQDESYGAATAHSDACDGTNGAAVDLKGSVSWSVVVFSS